MKKIKIYLKENSIFLLLLLIISIAVVLPLWITHRIIIFSDFSFHASRVEEIANNLANGNIFTFIATKTFHHSGVATFLFYPSIFLYPWAFFSIFTNPINAFYLWYLLVTIFTFWIAYQCMLSFSNNKNQSFIFSLLYTLVPYRLYLGTSVFGEFLAFTFLPIVFLGVYKILFEKDGNIQWWILSIGLSLVGYSHLLSVFLSIQFLIIIFIFALFTKKINKKRLLSLLKSAALTLVLVFFEIIPFLQSFKNIYSPNQGLAFTTKAQDFVVSSFTNLEGNSSIGFILLVVLFVGYFLLRDWTYKLIYFLGILSCALATSIFPWRIFASSPLSVIQLTFRYLSYASLFLSAVGSKILIKLWINSKTKSLVALFSLFAIFFALLVSKPNIVNLRNFSSQDMISKKSIHPVKTIPLTTVVDKKNYKRIFNYSVIYGEHDYYPNQAVSRKSIKSILNNKLLVNGENTNYKLHTYPNYLLYTIELKKNSSVDLPALSYNGTFVKVNGAIKHYKTSNRGTVKINLRKGQNQIKIGYRPWIVYYIAVMVAVITWLGLLYSFIIRMQS